MKMRKTYLLSLVAVLLTLGSCKAYRDVENLSPRLSKELKAGPFEKSTLNKLVEGDQVVVKTLDGKMYYLTFKQINGDNLNGSVSKIDKKAFTPKENRDIPVSDIENLWVNRGSAAATAPVVVLLTMGIFFVIYAIAASSGGGMGW